LAVVLAVVAGAGCGAESGGLPSFGGPDGGSGEDARLEDAAGPPGPADIERACQTVVRLCERIDACAPTLLQLIWGDLPTGTERLLVSCRNDLGAPGTGATPATFATCADALSRATCAELFENRVVGCEARGQVEPGRVCGTDGQCATGLCRRGAAGLCGICAVKSGAGGPCRKDKNEDCERGLVCSPAERCAAPVARGGACDGERPCGFGLFCGRGGTCLDSAKSAGAPCTGEEGSCDFGRGLFCNGARVCQVVRVARAGESCGLFANPLTICSGGPFEQTCRPRGLGTCVAPAREGEVCGAGAMDRDCLPPAACVDGVCALPSAASCR
jgi:hypothetical protein